jgi:hypothetical protein
MLRSDSEGVISRKIINYYALEVGPSLASD